MKKTLLATLLISAMGVAVVNAATDNAAVTQQVEQMKTQFNLSDQDANRVSNILNHATMTDEDKAAKRAERMEKHIERRLTRMKEALELSDEQVAQLKTLMTQRRTQMQASREQAKADITAVLTPEQAAKFSEMHGKDKDRGRGHRGGMCDK